MEIFVLLFFALAYAIKGGSGNVLENWEDVRSRSSILERLMDGKVLSTIMVAVFAIVYYGGDEYMAVALPLAWLIAVSPSMGEEHGSVGYFTTRYWKHHNNLKDKIKSCFIPLDGYKPTFRGRDYDVKKALQRGVWIGAVFALFTGSVSFIAASLLFVPLIFIGQTLNRLILKKDGWTVAEPLIGLIFGLGMVM